VGLPSSHIETAWINCNLRLKGLLHCVTIAHSKAVVFGPSLSESIREVQQDLARLNLRLFSYGEGQATIGDR